MFRCSNASAKPRPERSGRNSNDVAEPPDLAGKRVLVVDDGLDTGATVTAALRQVRAAEASYVALAVPVGSPAAVEHLRAEADEVFALETPSHFRAVGQFYESFPQISDEEAMAYLDA